MENTFKVGLDFARVLEAISRNIYDTPLAFIRENVQNAVDAVRVQALRDGRKLEDPKFDIYIEADPTCCRIRDAGIGMTPEELKKLFWTIGSSGKLNDEARRAGCVGRFGIGGFANFGVCSALEVIWLF
jgi:molecular chaperone HtpG